MQIGGSAPEIFLLNDIKASLTFELGVREPFSVALLLTVDEQLLLQRCHSSQVNWRHSNRTLLWSPFVLATQDNVKKFIIRVNNCIIKLCILSLRRVDGLMFNSIHEVVRALHPILTALVCLAKACQSGEGTLVYLKHFCHLHVSVQVCYIRAKGMVMACLELICKLRYSAVSCRLNFMVVSGLATIENLRGSSFHW